MTRITLAVPYGDHDPDTTIDVPAGEARTLLHTGRARLADAETTTDVAVYLDDDDQAPSPLG